tara:strand:+ start:37755 stop:39071 length:1317 start_codon:yes stop_codon:yes gene_type:complete
MNSEARKIRDVIEEFLAERLQGKLEPFEKALAKLESPRGDEEIESKIVALREQFERETWIESAAARVGQLQLVHFAAKFSNPYSKSSSRYLHSKARKSRQSLVSCSTTEFALSPDVVGNAAALDTYKFLSLELEGISLLERAVSGSAAFQEALSDDPKRGTGWSACFAAIVEDKLPIESHQYAKQVYFPLGNGEYHLLSPLYPTSLVHAVRTTINETRYGEESKEARKARRERRWNDCGYAEYSDLTIQKFGGTKPQNVSQLNSQRGGEALLLSSCPPTWDADRTRAPVGSSSIFKRVLYQSAGTRHAIDKLGKFLNSTDYNNANIRRERARLVEAVCDEVLFFASSIQALDSGWSQSPDCRLDDVEALWLDPGRAQEDLDFASRRTEGRYLVEVASRFARWLNGALKRKKIVLGDTEYKEWQSQLLDEIRRLPLEVN